MLKRLRDRRTPFQLRFPFFLCVETCFDVELRSSGPLLNVLNFLLESLLNQGMDLYEEIPKTCIIVGWMCCLYVGDATLNWSGWTTIKPYRVLVTTILSKEAQQLFSRLPTLLPLFVNVNADLKPAWSRLRGTHTPKHLWKVDHLLRLLCDGLQSAEISWWSGMFRGIWSGKGKGWCLEHTFPWL